MPIRTECENCGREIRARDESAGRRIRCPDCSEPVTLPGQRPPRAENGRAHPTGDSFSTPLILGAVISVVVLCVVGFVSYHDTGTPENVQVAEELRNPEAILDEAEVAISPKLSGILDAAVREILLRGDGHTIMSREQLRIAELRKAALCATPRELEIAIDFMERGFLVPAARSGERPDSIGPGETPVSLAEIDFGVLAEWRSCRSISFKGLPVTDTALAQIVQVTDLQFLDLSGTNVTDAGLQHLLTHDHLQHLDLSRTQITDMGLRVLGEHPSLGSLELDETQVTGQGLDGFLAPLVAVSFHRTQFKDEYVPLLAGLTRLKRLQLSECPHVTDAALPHLSRLTHLELLNLYASSISEAEQLKLSERR